MLIWIVVGYCIAVSFPVPYASEWINYAWKILLAKLATWVGPAKPEKTIVVSMTPTVVPKPTSPTVVPPSPRVR